VNPLRAAPVTHHRNVGAVDVHVCLSSCRAIHRGKGGHLTGVRASINIFWGDPLQPRAVIPGQQPSNTHATPS